VLCLALGLGPRHRDIWVLPPFLKGMPAVDGEFRLEVVPGQHVAGDPLSLPGGDLCPGVQEDLRAACARRDVVTQPTAGIFSQLAPGNNILARYACARSVNEMVTCQSSWSIVARL
jgi:hypothetical protein